MIHYHHYRDREARHWGSVSADPSTPQIWQDEILFGIFFREEFERLLQRASSAGSPVLELGCGEGHLAVELASRNCAVEGIDLSPERILRAQDHARERGVSRTARFSVGDLNTITLPENTYRCVVAHDSLHHILHLDHLMDEVSRALVPGGRFCVLDFAGMSRLRKLLAAGLYAILPTVLPYAEKWKLRKRLRGFLASEQSRREALSTGESFRLHPDSPFEEISQASIIPTVARHLEILHYRRFLPFWYYLAPKLRLPDRARYPVARLFRVFDDALSGLGVPGAYFSLEARKP